MIIIYLITLFALGIYSYSQIDLNLTLLQTPWFLQFQHLMIQLGYYQRPLSTLIYAVLLAGLFFLYFLLLRRNPNLKILVVGIVLLTIFAYPAFSHDFFNYLFDARIVTHYGQNPYLFRALDFPADTWTRFMHWTHRTYPYGPTWLLLTLVPSFLGFNKFILTVLNFKILFAGAYVGSVFLIKKIAGEKSALFFAANPLVIIESLVSPHLDAVMAFFFLLGIFLLATKNRFLAILAILFSGGIKFLTLVTLPLVFWPKKFKEFSLILLLIILIPVIFMREAYPWYFLPALAVAALLIENKKIFFLAIVLSFGLTLRYLPFLYLGQESLLPENLLTIIPVLLCGLSLIFCRRR